MFCQSRIGKLETSESASTRSAETTESDTGSNSSRPEAVSTAARLIDVAGPIFAAKGPDATVREICKEANCSVAAVNYYFGDKSKLYLKCVQAACERKKKLFPLPDITSNEDASELLRKFLRTFTSRMAAKANLSWHNTLMLREVIAPSEGVAEMLSASFGRDFKSLEDVLSFLLGPEYDSESVRRDLAMQIVARCMFLRTGVNLRSILALNSESHEDPDQYADLICNSVLLQINALKSNPGESCSG